MDSEQSLFSRDEEQSVGFWADERQEDYFVGLQGPAQKDDEIMEANLDQQINDIPHMNDEILDQQSLCMPVSEAGHSDFQERDPAKEAELHTLYYDHCTQPGRDYMEVCPPVRPDQLSHSQGYLESFGSERGKSNTPSNNYQFWTS